MTKKELRKLKERQKPIIIDLVDSVDFEPIKIFVGIENKILPNGRTVNIVKAQTSSYELTFTSTAEKGVLVAKQNFFIRITSIDKKFDRCFEEIVRFPLKEEEMKKNVPILYQKVFELSEGKYTLVFLIRDIETGKTGIQKINFEVN